MLKDKGLVIGIVITILLIAGGVFLMTRNSGSSSQVVEKVSSEILVPSSATVTGGMADGKYLAASTSAEVTLVEFGDYECPACVYYHPMIKQLLSEFSGKLNFTFRNYPLDYHTNALVSAYAVEAAGLQDKYWQMHDKVYESTDEWVDIVDARSIFVGYAESLGLDVEKFKIDIDSEVVKQIVQRDTNDGNLVKLNATPTFYLNGIKIERLSGSYEDLRNLINTELNKD